MTDPIPYFNRFSNPFNNKDLAPREKYEKLFSYYENNSLYASSQLTAYFGSTWVEAMRSLRGVVNRSVEFYVSKICPSIPRIVTDIQAVKDAIDQLYKWSNFSAIKQIGTRNLALYGDLFWKIVTSDDKVFIEIVDPLNVTDFKADSRGNITEIRIDVPVVEGDITKTYTEYWTKADGYYSTWVHQLGRDARLDELGDPTDFGFLAEFGIDFLPFVHVKFRDIGKLRGVACVDHALDKIDEANRQATRLSQMLFRYNKPLWVVSANDKDAMGRPMPAPKVKPATGTTPSKDLDTEEDSSMVYMPGISTLNSLVPPINYDQALNVLNAMMSEIKEDLPELNYYSLTDTNLSGKAIKLILAGAVDRAREAQTNFIQGLIRVNNQALTIGSYMGYFTNVGSYDSGSFDHSIVLEEIFPATLDEQATTVKMMVDAGIPLESALKKNGYTDEEIKEILLAKEGEDAKAQDALARSLMSFNQGKV